VVPTDGYFGIENFGWGPDYWLDVYANMYEPWPVVGYMGLLWELLGDSICGEYQ